MATMYTIVLLRHGESDYNKENRFCGWFDADLSELGVQEAKNAGKMLKEKNYTFDIAYSSVLKRALKTLFYVQDELDMHWLPVVRHWRLNERHYGGLQGLNKSETAAKHGEAQVKIWRRSYDTRPPALEEGDPRSATNEAKYAQYDKAVVPMCECLKDTVARVLPYWHDVIVPTIKSGQKVLISAHGNSLRALIKYLDNVSDGEITELNVPTEIHNENRPENEHIYASTINEEVSGVSQLLTDDSLIIGAEESFGNIPSPPEAVLIEEQDSENLSRHHAGPIGEEFITDKRARQKSFSKRMKTFQKSAKLLNTMCGASVKFTVVSESGRQTIGSFPSAKVRHVGLQVGQPTGTPVTRHTSTGTPKKTPAKLVKKIKNIPGKKEKKITTLQKAINKCAVCGIIFKSNKDKLFQKKHGLQGVWLGCEAEGCVFWGHAICANVIIGSRKMIPSIKLHERHP